MQPYFDPIRKEDLKQKWKTTSTKNEKWKTTSKKLKREKQE
jgi:hypothetical protein